MCSEWLTIGVEQASGDEQGFFHGFDKWARCWTGEENGVECEACRCKGCTGEAREEVSKRGKWILGVVLLGLEEDRIASVKLAVLLRCTNNSVREVKSMQRHWWNPRTGK